MIPYLDECSPKEFGRCIEPFLGGGALMLHLLQKKPEVKYVGLDINQDLILAYSVVRDSVDDLIRSLREHERSYHEDPARYYYMVRSTGPLGNIERISRMIFLNKTCFNGLYRVNSKGEFNVPLGSYTNPRIVDSENLRAVSGLLRSGDVSLKCSDFGGVLDVARTGDFVYFDPPYYPINKSASFTSYASGGFTHKDLLRLSGVCSRLADRGCHVMVSNSDSEVVRNAFCADRWNVRSVASARVINSNGSGRMGHCDLLITNLY